jgi:hypothetical protein
MCLHDLCMSILLSALQQDLADAKAHAAANGHQGDLLWWDVAFCGPTTNNCCCYVCVAPLQQDLADAKAHAAAMATRVTCCGGLCASARLTAAAAVPLCVLRLAARPGCHQGSTAANSHEGDLL